MKIIDAHIHFSPTDTLIDYASLVSKVDYSPEGYLKERESCGVVASVCMGMGRRIPGSETTGGDATPMLTALNPTLIDGDYPPPNPCRYGRQSPPTLTGASLLHPGSRGGVEAHINNTMGERSSLASTLPEAVWLCPGINPHSLSEEHLTVLREVSQSRQVVGLKIYAGYYHIDINSPVYEPVYRLAAEYGLPVAVHTGDTFAENGLMEYSHPLHMDRLAVTWRDVTFVMCHMGAPWVFEGCEIAYKNRNVYLDLSGLLIGDSQEVQEAAANRYWVERYQQPIVLLNQYEKLLFGTDWPLAPMADYIHFIATLIPEAYWQQVFYDNATKIYRGIV